MVRPVRHTQQAGGEVGAAHAWHAMRSGHPCTAELVTSAHRAPSGAYAERAFVCLFLAPVGRPAAAVMTRRPIWTSEAQIAALLEDDPQAGGMRVAPEQQRGQGRQEVAVGGGMRCALRLASIKTTTTEA